MMKTSNLTCKSYGQVTQHRGSKRASRYRRESPSEEEEEDEDYDEDYEEESEESDVRNRGRQRQGRYRGQGKDLRTIQSKVPRGLNYDEINEEDLDPDDETDRAILWQLHKSRSLKRRGTNTPYRNVDGSIDRRRIKQGQEEDFFEEEESGRGAKKQYRFAQRRSMGAEKRDTYGN